MYYEELPENCRLYARASVDNMALDAPGAYDLRRHTHARLRQQMADLIVREKTREERREYHTDFVIELLVLSRDELAKLIREEAFRLSRMMTHAPISNKA